jgi:hypothetical protein
MRNSADGESIMNETNCWTWRFDAYGHLEFGKVDTTIQWRRMKAAGWEKVNPSVVHRAMMTLAELYKQGNLYLIYRARHPRPEFCMTPELFQALYKGVAGDMAYTPLLLCDLGMAFTLPPVYFLKRRVQAVPRPQDGPPGRWDKITTIKQSGHPHVPVYKKADRRTPLPGVEIFKVGSGDSVSALEVAQSENDPFLYLHRTPRMYLITYEVYSQVGVFVVIETSKKKAETAFMEFNPEAVIHTIKSALALPGMAVDLM